MLEMRQILNSAGEVVDAPVPEVGVVRSLYEGMVAARQYNRKCTALQRQGRLATYASFEGQEAAQIGSAAALDAKDWMVATYRDAAAMWAHGYPWLNLILGRTGDERGGSPPDGVPVLPPSITVGAHMIHAVGLAWASKLGGEDRVAIAYFGDGATSEGDFHEAMNFAGVYKTPTIFLCQNNGWAISLPTERQTASETIAQKASAYGMGGVLVDGNDALAVHTVTSEAIDLARSGGGPTLIEALTYRVGAHTTADDHGRYRDLDDVEQWRSRDPLKRVRRYLERLGEWSAEWQDQLESAASDDLETAVAEAEAIDPLPPDKIFTAMFATSNQRLDEQQTLLARDRGELS